MSLTGAQFVKFIERLVRTWMDNDTPTALAHFTEDAIFIEPPDLQRHKGHNELRLFFDDLTPGTKMTLHNLWFDEATQRGAVEFSFRLGGWENEANHGVAVVEMRDGLIASWCEYQRRGPVSFEDFLGKGRGEEKEKLPSARAGTGKTEVLSNERLQRGVQKLKSYLEKIPAVSEVEASDASEPEWWLKFSIDIESPIAWHVVQELGHLLNYISMNERLPTLFMPVSPPPYINGGPGEFLSWVIEAKGPGVDAGELSRILEERLPVPVDDIASWLEEGYEEGEEDEDEVEEDEDND